MSDMEEDEDYFDDDDDSGSFEDDGSDDDDAFNQAPDPTAKEAEFKCLAPEECKELASKAVKGVMELLCCDTQVAQVLLRQYKWDQDKLVEGEHATSPAPLPMRQRPRDEERCASSCPPCRTSVLRSTALPSSLLVHLVLAHERASDASLAVSAGSLRGALPRLPRVPAFPSRHHVCSRTARSLAPLQPT